MINKETKEIWEKFSRVFSPENQAKYSINDWESVLKQQFINELFVRQISHSIPYTLYRGRMNPKANNSDINFQRTDELWAPPKEFSRQGRCNKEGTSLLYCTTDLTTIIYELRPEIGDEVTIIEYDCLKELGPLIMVGIKEILDKKLELAKNILDYYDALSTRSQLVDYMIGHIFKSDKNSSFPQLYNITNALTSIFLNEQVLSEIPKKYMAKKNIGLIYPSVTYGDAHGVNVVLVPELAKKILKPILAYKYLVVDKLEDHSFKIKLTHITTNIFPAGQLEWQKKASPKLETIGTLF